MGGMAAESATWRGGLEVPDKLRNFNAAALIGVSDLAAELYVLNTVQ